MDTSAHLMQASEYLHALQNYWWPFCRILAMFSLTPLFSHKALTKQTRVLLALAITIALGGALPPSPNINPFSAQGLFTTLEQIAFGLLLGLTMQLALTIFSLVGEVIATQMGMSMARFSDPVNGVSSSSIIYQLYFLFLIIVFLSIDGHLLTISVLFKSFVFWPIGSGLSYHSYNSLLNTIGWVFSASVLLTLPIVFSMVIVQFCFGLLNRISPAMNLFSLGFPITIVVGLVCIYLTLPNLPQSYLHLTSDLLNTIGLMMQGDQHV